ncbi:hypothetical protein G9A89_004154 [Geosiphon pyriformis]|nr:hypothetical protein G9A89_004154 [Geosiphon pyriformis]
MDLKTALDSNMSKKKAPKEAFYGSAGGSFALKKKVVLGNVKHSGDEKNISLIKSGSGNSVYSNVDSLSGNNKDVGMAGINDGPFLNSAAITPKAKYININAAFGFPLGFSNFDIDDDEEVSLPLCFSIFLDKKWVDPKIVKTQVKVSIRQSFALDINLSADSVCVAKVVGNHKTCTSKDWFRALLFTLLMGMMAHDFRTLLKRANGKTCIINRSLKTGNRICCAVVGFESDNDLKIAFYIKPILGRIKLSWARMDLVWCEKCGKFGYSALECDASVVFLSKLSKTFKRVVSNERHFQLAKLYKKKSVSIFYSTVFGNKSWAQVVSFAGFSDGLHFASGSGSPLSGISGLNNGFPSVLAGNLFLDVHLVSLKQSLKLLTDQVSGIVCKLSSIELVPLVLSPSSGHSVAPIVVNVDSDSNMVLDGLVVVPATPSNVLALGFSSSKILTTKIDCLESKLVALKASIGSVLVKLDQLCIGLGFLFTICNIHGINVPAKQMNVMYWYVNSGNMVSFVTETKLRSSIKPWIANKFESVCVFTSGLDKDFLGTGVAIIINNSLASHVSKVKKISGRIISVWLLFKGKLSVTILDLYIGAFSETRFGQALKVNFLIAEAVNSSTFVVLGGDFNENESERSATFKFCLGLSLVCSVSGFFDTDYSAVSVLIGLSGLLDDCLSAKLLIVANEFLGAEIHGDVNAMWTILERVVVESANKTFLKQWFSEFHCFRNKFSSKFFSLELLVAKISTLNNTKACVFANLVGLSEKIEVVLRHLSLVCKKYRRSKIYESKVAEKASIKLAISKCIENFCFDKSSMIRSVLDWPSYKVVLDHLIVDNELILEPEKVKLNVDKIMEGWIRKQVVLLIVPDLWAYQYALLDYVQNCVFSNVIGVISLNELLLVVNGLPDGKAAGFVGIFLEIIECIFVGQWCSCFVEEDLDEVLMNMWPIALIETARKILSKILFNSISSVYSKFGVLWGDNFSILKSMSIQSPVFAVGLIVKDALEKAKKGEAYKYLGIFLSTKELSKPSVAKAYSDVHFFVNVVFRKFITDKQFSYLVAAVLQPIVSYRTQFSFVSLRVCHKWDAMVQKSFRSKAHLPCNFPVKALHHLLLYGLKSFEQLQSECKSAAVISFSNAPGIFGHLFNHRFLDLQVLGWASLNSLQFPVKLHVSPINNFLAGVVKIFFDSELSLANNLPSAFCSPSVFPISFVLENALYFSLKKLDAKGPVPFWFVTVLKFLMDVDSSLATCTGSSLLPKLDVLNSVEFSDIQSGLHEIWSSSFDVYTDSSLRDIRTAGVVGGTAAYFLSVDLSVGIKVQDLLFSTLSELQVVTLALECISFSCTVVLYLDSQAAIDVKGKDHSGITSNVMADAATGHATCSKFSLPMRVCECFLVAKAMAMSGNAHHFVKDAGPGQIVVLSDIVGCVNWSAMAKVWHSNFYMLAGFTSWESSSLCTYLIKAVHQQLSIAVRKRLYNRRYSGMLCLLCGKVELPDHVFTCASDAKIWREVLAEAFAFWTSLLSVNSLFFSAVLQTLSWCSSDIGLYLVLCKGFVFKNWCEEAVDVFNGKKKALCIVVEFADMERAELVGNNSLVLSLSHCIGSVLSEGMIRMLENVNLQPTDIYNIQEKRPKTSMVTTPDTTTLEYYQSIYTHCKQRFNISDGIEVVKKSVYQYIENCINNYLFGNYNISEVRSNLYNNLVHYLQLETENLNSETLATYFQELNFNIIEYCEEKYPVQPKYSYNFKLETETSNKGKQKMKQYSRTTPNTLILPKTTAKHLQTPEQETSVKLLLSITLFPILLSPRNPTQQQEPISTSANIIDYLQENDSNHSESLKSEETKSEPEEITGNKKEMTTAYIAKIPEFTGENNDTSLQEWLDKVQKAGDANGWIAARMLKAIFYFLQKIAGKWFENLEEPFENWQAFKDAFLQQFTNNNISITLCNHFRNIKQETSKTILDQFIAGLKNKLIKKVRSHAPADLAITIRHIKNYEMAMEEANHTKLVNLTIGKTSLAAEEKINQLTKKNNNNRINPNNQLVLQNSGQQRPNHYHTQSSYLIILEESDFQQSALSEGKVAAFRSNSSNNTIPLAQIAQNANLSNIFSFEFEANESPFLLSNAAANEQRAITAMYTEATVKRKPIQLILNSGLAGSIITYQLMQQLQRTVDRSVQTVIVTADGIKKTPVRKIDNFPFTIDGITILVKVLVMNAPQYQALIGNDWLLKANANLNWETQELKILYQEQYTIVPATCGIFNK